MRKLFTSIGLLAGAYLGWKIGSAFDALVADFVEKAPGHVQSIVFACLFAVFGGYGLRRATIALTRKPVRVIELVPEDSVRPRVSLGRTPPTPRPAFQA